jgi:hypothetical protein
MWQQLCKQLKWQKRFEENEEDQLNKIELLISLAAN